MLPLVVTFFTAQKGVLNLRLVIINSFDTSVVIYYPMKHVVIKKKAFCTDHFGVSLSKMMQATIQLSF